MNIFSKLKYLTGVTNNEKIIVEYILRNPEHFIQQSATQISKECYVSKSSMYRLCSKLELSGLSELKVQVSSSLDAYLKEDRNFDFNFPVKENELHATRQLKENYIQTITTTFNLLDLEQLKAVAKVMKNARSITIYTSAGNVFFGENFKFQMKEIGVTVSVPIEEYQQRLFASTSNNQDVSIIISFEGRGSLVAPIIKILKKTKSPIVCITSAKNDTLKKDADYVLYLNANENHYRKVSSFSTRCSLLYVLDCLYACYFDLEYQNNMKKKLLYYQLLSDNTTK